MAVYTQVSAEVLDRLLARYDVGTLRSAKGIAEGVENSNYLVETSGGQFILTLYEERVDFADLPFFLALTDHLAAKGLPVPRAVRDRAGAQLQEVAGRPACLIEFLPGVSPSEPPAAQCRTAANALGRMHTALEDFPGRRENTMGIASWRPLAERCFASGAVSPDLAGNIARELDWLDAHWPHDLARSIIHADLFPDNVLMLGDEPTGLIDFYFSCTDLRALDLAIMHGSWCFSGDGETYHADRAAALREGYATARPVEAEEVAHFATLCRGAALRFTLSRLYDWVNTPADALVTRKDPLAYVARLQRYRTMTGSELLGL